MITKTYENIEPFFFYRKFFELYNVVQTSNLNKLRSREIDILAAMLCLGEEYKFVIFKAKGKRAILEVIKKHTNEELTINNLNSHFTELKTKGLVIEQSDNMRYVNPKILKYLNMKDKKFEFIFKFNLV